MLSPHSFSLFLLTSPFMPISDVEAVLQFLNKNGFSGVESILREEVLEKAELGSFDYERFLFPMVPPPLPANIPALSRRSEVLGGGDCSRSSSISSDEFLSAGSSDFINPYRIQSTSRENSEASSDGLSEFGTARDYPENDLFWYDEKDDGNFTTACLEGPDLFGCPSEDKFIMTFQSEKQYDNQVDLEKPCPLNFPQMNEEKKIHVYLNSKETDSIDFCLNVVRDITTDCDFASQHEALKEKDYIPYGADSFEGVNPEEVNQERHDSADRDDVVGNELLMYNAHEDDGFEVFNLRIIHRKNRTGFEENKDLPLDLNTIIAGRYYITEHLGAAAFSRVVMARDLHTGVDVCLKIIKNDKDFFDQSLDEIKLLKLVNKHDPADERHILRLYDYFYHREHLFIVCELLRANLYEFQKFNQESGEEVYFTLSRLQVITCQCLEALEFLHHLGIIHCDLKPENILIKSYRRCEIKVIDLGSSCFLSDNLCLYVQSRSYRAPEVILGLPYDQKIDMWSLGCILAELCSGEVLFPNDAVVTILARMIGILGPIDMEMLIRGQETHKYFTQEYDLYHVNEEKEQLEYIIPEESSLENHLQVTDVGFIDFITSLLQINPERRPTAKEALQHPWLSHVYENNPC